MNRTVLKNIVIGIITFSVVFVLTRQDERVDRLEIRYGVALTQAQSEYEARKRAEAEVTHLRAENKELLKQLRESKVREEKALERASRSRRVADVAVRTTDRSVASGSGNSLRATSLGKKEITGYCATGNRTASGKVPRPGMVATLDRRIKFGTRVRIDGVGTFVVEDRIGHSSEFDIFFGSCAEARQFGRRYLRVEIL